MSKKAQVLEAIYKYCLRNNSFEFDNNLVKQFCHEYDFGNPYDATKLDSVDKIPKLIRDDDYCILHLGEGRHKFIKGVSNAYHSFESINDDEIKDFTYKSSILNEFDTSESNILSVGFNQKVVHEFLYNDITASPKMYGARRTKTSISYQIGNETISINNLQMEIDLTAEYSGDVTVFEGKNNFPKTFATYQIYLPFLYYHNLKESNELEINNIDSCYLLRKKVNDMSILRLYRYTFTNPFDMTSLKLLQKKQYNLIKNNA